MRLANLIIVCSSLFVFASHENGSADFAPESSEYKFPAETVTGKEFTWPTEHSPRITVFCFLGAECPLAKLYGPRLQRLADRHAKQDVEFVGIGSNRQDSADDLKDYATECEIRFPIVRDEKHILADQFKAKRTPEVVVLDDEKNIRYRGRIDDQYEPGILRPEPKRNDLERAIIEILDRQPVRVRQTRPVGCLIGRKPKTKAPTQLTYAKEISRVLSRHCVECHRPGEIGPFSLTNYEEITGWGETLLEVIEDGRMPPWHANPAHGEFTNARQMPEHDKAQLREWVDGGMPFGNQSDLPEAVETTTGWQLPRKPDRVLSMSRRHFQVPAEGVVDYQYFVVDPEFSQDTWITAAQVVPGNAAVVHHCIVFIRPPDGRAFQSVGYLTGYVPGQRTALMPAGYARFVPAGSRLVFQMHYTPTGTRQSDLTKIGLLIADESTITHRVSTLTVLNRDFEIPPNAANFVVKRSTSRFPKDGKVLAITPHMHYRGKSFRVTAERKTGADILLDVPRYDFNWQHIYELKTPLPLADVKSLGFTAHFDNSAGNPFNPDPTRNVTWGDQTWEEMAIAFFEIATPRAKSLGDSTRKVPEKRESKNKTAEAFADRFFENFDQNGDGVIFKSELPLAQQRFGFRKFDRNGDGKIDRDEVRQIAEKR